MEYNDSLLEVINEMIDYKKAEMWKKNIFEVIRIVAAPYEIQKKSFPEFVSVADEIALTFYEEVMLRSDTLFKYGMLEEKQYEETKKLNHMFDEMSKNKTIWTLEALRNSAEWEQCRKIAKEILSFEYQ